MSKEGIRNSGKHLYLFLSEGGESEMVREKAGIKTDSVVRNFSRSFTISNRIEA